MSTVNHTMYRCRVMKAGVDLEKLKKEIESGEFDEAIGEELDREIGLTAEDIALIESLKKNDVAGKKVHTLQVKPVKKR